jgi:single-stranded DNA-binding protein
VSDVNVAVVSGSLEKDPVISSTNTGIEMANFSLVCTEEYQGKTKEILVKCMAWGDTATAVAELHQGDLIVVQGKLNGKRSEKSGYISMELTVSRFIVPFQLGAGPLFQ